MWRNTGLALALAGLTVGLAGCASGAPPPPVEKAPAAAEGRPEYGGSFRMRVAGSEIPSFDPRQEGITGQYFHLSALVYSSMMRYPYAKYATSAPMECNICERWEQPDTSTYVFHLRQGIKWHNKPPVNGRELVAEDIRWAMTDGEGVDVKNPRYIRWTRDLSANQIARIETPDKYTVKIALKQPYAPFLQYMGSPYIYHFAPPEAVAAARSETNKEGFVGQGLQDISLAIGTGPFTLKEYTPKVGGVLARNPDYFRKAPNGDQLPYLDEVRLLYIPDHKLRTNAMLAGQLDSGGIYLDDFDVAKLEKDGRFSIDHTLTGFGPFVLLNTARKPFDDVRLRRAFHLIVDRYEVMKPTNMRLTQVQRWTPSAWEPYGTPLEVVEKLPGYRSDKTEDHAEAQKILKELGLDGGFKLNLAVQTGGQDEQFATVLQAQLKAFKIDANIEVLDRATTLQRRVDGAFEAMMQPQLCSGPDPEDCIQEFTRDARENSKFSHPELDRLDALQAKTLDVKERAKIFGQIYDLLDQQQPSVSLFRTPWFTAWRKEFQGYMAQPHTEGIIHWVDQVWRKKS